MSYVSIYDMLKIGIGPSSSHTLGPWRAALAFLKKLEEKNLLNKVFRVETRLYGSLALTGIGHGTDIAVMMGLSGFDPVIVPLEKVKETPQLAKESQILILAKKKELSFNYDADIVFYKDTFLPYHANGVQFIAYDDSESIHQETYYSVGGGFIVQEEAETLATHRLNVPFPFENAKELHYHCLEQMSSIFEIVLENELSLYSKEEARQKLDQIWEVMLEAMYKGCHTGGILPGGIGVERRAARFHKRLKKSLHYTDSRSWLDSLREEEYDFAKILSWVSCFAMAVNEENASFGRIVTSPTNGSAGVIPAVLLYYIVFVKREYNPNDIYKFLLTAGAIGSIFKQGATISAAMGGCQAEIGVSSAMAAAALTQALGGSVRQCLEAAEIAMEHHLGLTCDPIGGLVQVPCIERNSMGAMKAITATNIALESDPTKAKVSLDDIVKTMWETAQDMNTKYKETALGGLATNVKIMLPEC